MSTLSQMPLPLFVDPCLGLLVTEKHCSAFFGTGFVRFLCFLDQRQSIIPVVDRFHSDSLSMYGDANESE